MTKRHILTTVSLTLAVALAGCAPEPGATSTEPPAASQAPSARLDALQLEKSVAALEEQYDARVGVMIIDTATGQSIGHRQHERFSFASTIKALIAAEFLKATTPEQREEIVTWTQADIDAAGHAPSTAEHQASGLTLRELAEAAVRSSDNVASNLLMRYLSGPEAVMEELSTVGDLLTDLRDEEPGVNTTPTGTTANTTTPSAFADTLRNLISTDYLPNEDRAALVEWMSGNSSGDALISAGAPADWTIAEKSGGVGGTRNDIAIAVPPSGDPLMIVILTAKAASGASYEDQLVADVAAAVFTAFSE